MNVRIINAPLPEVVDMLRTRMRPSARARLETMSFDTVGLLQTSVADMFYFADIAQKAAGVLAVELLGSCPQHISTLALFGDTSAVETAVRAIESQQTSFG